MNLKRQLSWWVFFLSSACAPSANTSTVEASDAQALLHRAVSHPLTETNHPPVIQALTANPKNSVAQAQPISFTLQAYDADGDPLKYYWHSDKGLLSKPEGLNVYWQANQQNGVANIHLTVSDGKGGEAQATAKILMQPDGKAQLVWVAQEMCGNNTQRFTEIYRQDTQP